MRIVFQGDSITDVGRNTNNGSLISMGQGYPLMITGDLSAKYPGEYEFVNRGISGNRVVDIYARIKKDCWNLEPDVLSLLIGVNDVWHEFNPDANGVDAARFEKMYRILAQDTLERFPNCKIIAMEPFVLHGPAVDENWEGFYSEVLLRAKAVRKVAEELGLIFVPLQEKLEEACKLQPSTYWLGDGVHPTPAGHRLIANAWEEAFEANIR